MRDNEGIVIISIPINGRWWHCSLPTLFIDIIHYYVDIIPLSTLFIYIADNNDNADEDSIHNILNYWIILLIQIMNK